MDKQARARGKKPAAQAMVEFGLALPILLLVVYGLIEAGRLVFIYASVVSAARQAVRYGSATGDNQAGTPYYNDCTGIRNAAKNLAFIQPFRDADIQISYDNGPGALHPWSQATCPITSTSHPINGDRIYVRVSAQYAPIVPLVPFRPFTISSSGWRTLLVGISVAVDAPFVVLTPGSGSVSIVKDALCSQCSPPGSYYEWAGQTISYTYTLYNNGSDPVTINSVSDSLIGNADCSGALSTSNPLNPGARAACSGTYTITASDVTNAKVTNVATFNGVDAVTSQPVEAETTKTINFVPKPQLNLIKNATEPAIVQKGSIITYTYTLTNVGNVTLFPPYAVSDNNVDSPAVCSGTTALAPGTWSNGTVATGGSTTCTAQHTITNNDINTTYVDNTATATAFTSTGFKVTSNSASQHVLVPELLLGTSASTGIACAGGTGQCVDKLGETITYTYTLKNRTASTINNIKINDGNGAALSGCPTSLASQATGTCTGTYSGYTQSQFDSGVITDQVTASAQAGINSNLAVVSVGVNTKLSLQLTKTPSVQTATTVGAGITYTYRLTNNSNVTLKSPYAVTDNMIPSVSCSGASSSLAPNGGSTTCTATYSVAQTDIDNGAIVNTATATATYNPSSGAQTVTSNQASATVITYTSPRLALTKTATPNVFSASGQTITYTFTFKNTGGVTLTAPYTLLDPMFPSLTGCTTTTSLTPTQSMTCNSVAYATTLVDVANATIKNTAAGTATVNGTNTTVSASGSATVSMFLCDRAHLTYSPTLIPTGSDEIWTVTNNTGLTIHIASMTVSWDTGITVPALLQVLLNNTTIWSGTNASAGGFIVPGGPWAVLAGNNPIEVKFTAAASNIRIVVSFVEPSCPILDSSKAPG